MTVLVYKLFPIIC